MFKLFMEMSMLTFEAQQAIWLRSMKIAAGGPAAKRETNLMVKEKFTAAQTAVLKAATGTGPVAIARGYRRKVRANVRRLSK
jgi:polyhydroxyalkanoate synthesis regulator protein